MSPHPVTAGGGGGGLFEHVAWASRPVHGALLHSIALRAFAQAHCRCLLWWVEVIVW